MKVQLIQQNNMQQKQPQFKGIADTGLRFLATNQGVGANLTDLGFMVIPRVTTDAKRGPAACVETARREASGTANHSLVGVYGMTGGLAAAALMGMNKNFKVNANKIFAAPETLNILAENKARQVKNNTTQADYLRETLKNVKAFNPSAANADKDGYVKLSEETVEELVKLLDKAVTESDFDKWKKKDSVNSLNTAMNKIIADTGAESKYILESAEAVEGNAKKLTSETSLKTLLEDIYKLSDSFNKENVQNAFKEQVRNGNAIKDNAFIKKLTRFSKIRSLAGFGIATGVGMSIQPMNIYLTKKKTGSDGFVGVEGRSKDNSTQFKLMKGAAGAGFLGLTLATLGTANPAELMKKIAFKGFWPTIPQLKGIYGLTIISRLLATRDKDELRESLTKDTLGFLSWLVLGDIVNRVAANSLDKSVMNRTKDVEGKGYWGRLFNSSLKTRDEVLVETLSKNGIATVKENGVAKTFKEMLKDLDGIKDAQVKKLAKKKLGTLNKAQAAGYLFSGIVLGLGIPNLNIYITNALDKKRKAAKAAEEQQNAVA
ncbi:MAG: hypothetical protein NC408_01370 [Candidatus Gastranaerophilales bacterium]|nr:hypothetical protein [Candidatus Gastranaerophilales bacterium]MCM1072232.1 hypothetical protein [Bacteroides sp.]